MDTQLDHGADELRRTQRCINDLVSLLALPAVWVGNDPTQIARTLLDALLSMLRLDFVYMRLNEPDGGAPKELFRAAQFGGQPDWALTIGASLDRSLGQATANWPTGAHIRIAGADLSIATMRLGLRGELGVVVAGSARTDFPGQNDRLLLNVAANQAAIALQEAHRRSGQGRIARELDERVAQRTRELVAANEELRLEIAERHRVEAALRESERSSQLIIDTIPGLVVTMAPTGEIDTVNAQVLEYCGGTLEDIRQWETNGTVHVSDLHEVVALFTSAIATGESFAFEARIRRHDGVYRWFQIRGLPLRDASSHILRWYALLTDINERKQAEEALQQSEARLAEAERESRLTLDSIPTITWRAAPTGYVQQLNKRWFEYTGTTPEQVRGWRWKLCVHPDDLDHLVDVGREYVATGTSSDCEARLRRFDGEYRWFLFRPAPTRDETGHIVGWYGTITDIQDRKQAEQKAIDAEREMQHMLDSIPAIIVRGATNGYIQYLNKQWFEYTGSTLETARGFRWQESLHPDDKDRLVEFGARFVASAVPADCEARLRRHDGVYRWFLFRPAPAHDETGRFIGWYGTVTDIEDRKHAEEKAAEAERELQRTIDNVPIRVSTYTADGSRISVNKRIVEITGLPVEGTLGDRWFTLFHPDDVEAFRSHWNACLATGEPFERETRARTADGAYRWLLIRRVPLRDESGKIIRWYGVGYDIDNQRQAEQALAASERNLKLTIDTIPAVAWSAFLDGSAEFFNQNYLDYVGLSLEQVQGWGWIDAVHPDDREVLAARWRAVLASGTAGEAEARIRRNDGEYRWFLIRANPLRDEAGNIVKWYGANTDIEDRKRADTLRLGEKHLLELVASGRPLRDALAALCKFFEEAAPDCYCDAHLIDWSSRTFEYGVAPSLPDSYTAPIAGLPVRADLVPCGIAVQDKVQVIAEDIDTDPRWCASSVRTHVLEHGLRSVWSTPILSKGGAVLGTLCIYQRKPARPSQYHQDLIAHATHIASIAIERSRAATALQRSETFLSEGQRISLTGSFSWRVDTDDFVFSEELRRIFEFEPNVVLTLDRIGERVHPDDLPLLAEKQEQIRAGNDNPEYEIRLRMPDGRIKYTRVFGRLIRHEDGRLECLGAVQDVTERRLAEEALDRARSELAHVTRVMSLGALTASIAHEVNQPLAGIITNASTCLRMLAADPPNVDGARETARRTIRDGNRAADVITRLRALFSKKGAATDAVDLNEATREVLALVSGDLLRNRIVLRAELDDEPLLVTGDRVQLQQVILNLVRNASDAMSDVSDRSRHLLIKVDIDQERRARLVVRDAGVGFAPDDTERLFDAFYTTKSGGMGMGLCLSRSIIEGHGGKLCAEVNDDHGATFSLFIPLQDKSEGNHVATSVPWTLSTRGDRDEMRK